METLGLVGLVFAVGLFLNELKERQEDRIVQAWQLITAPAPGNSGKREALEYLNSRSLCLPIGLQLPIYGNCWKERVSLTGIDLSSQRHGGSVYLENINLEGANLENANLSGTYLLAANLQRSRLTGTDLSNAQLTGVDFSQAHIVEADLTRAVLISTEFRGARIVMSNLTETFFTTARTREATLLANWEWENRPPKRLDTRYSASLIFRNTSENKGSFAGRLREELRKQASELKAKKAD